MKDNLKIMSLQGEDILPYLLDLARLRIEVFKAYPYLYAGQLDYEEKYLQTYATSAGSVMVLVFDGMNVVGASTAIPLASETEACQKPFLENNMNIDKIFYLGESVLLPQYRGNNVYRLFFEEREKAALEQGFHTAVFCAVDRSPDDPRRPPDYQPLDPVWRHFGYEKHSELKAYYEWTEIGEAQETAKPLTFWLKQL